MFLKQEKGSMGVYWRHTASLIISHKGSGAHKKKGMPTGMPIVSIIGVLVCLLTETTGAVTDHHVIDLQIAVELCLVLGTCISDKLVV